MGIWDGAFELVVTSFSSIIHNCFSGWSSLKVKSLLWWANGLERQFSHHTMILTSKKLKGSNKILWSYKELFNGWGIEHNVGPWGQEFERAIFKSTNAKGIWRGEDVQASHRLTHSNVNDYKTSKGTVDFKERKHIKMASLPSQFFISKY